MSEELVSMQLFFFFLSCFIFFPSRLSNQLDLIFIVDEGRGEAG